MAVTFHLASGEVLVVPSDVPTVVVGAPHDPVTHGRAIVEVERLLSFARSVQQGAEHVDQYFLQLFERKKS